MATTYSMHSAWESLQIQPRLSPQQAQSPSVSILIVDDSPEIRQCMRMGLEDLGYQCEEAQHGLEALRKLQHFSCNVVLTDLQMPFLDGMGLAQQIRENQLLGNPLVIMMTASNTWLLDQLGLAFGIKEILAKPCSPTDVDRIIRQHQSTLPRAA